MVRRQPRLQGVGPARARASSSQSLPGTISGVSPPVPCRALRTTSDRPAVRVDNLPYGSGYEPRKADGTPLVGKLGRDLSTNEGAEAARQIALLVLSVVRAELGSLDNVVRLVKTFGMVNCMPDFTQT